MATSTTRKRKTGTAVQTPLETYLREINETPLLNGKEEKELATRIGQGDTRARDQMVRANLRLVVNIARGYSGKGLGLQDLIEEGNLGLLRAVEGFDPAMGTRFSTYASYWIKQSIKRALINTGKTIRIPAYMVELLSKWRRATARLTEELGRSPTPEEVARVLGLAKKKLPIIKKAIKIYNATPQTDQSEAGWTLGDMVMDERQIRQTMRSSKAIVCTRSWTCSQRWTSARPRCSRCASAWKTTSRARSKKSASSSASRASAYGRSRPKRSTKWPKAWKTRASGCWPTPSSRLRFGMVRQNSDKMLRSPCLKYEYLAAFVTADPVR